MLTQEQMSRARLHALRNAQRYGKADAGSVIGKMLAEFPELKTKAKELHSDLQKVIADTSRLSDAEKEAILASDVPKEAKQEHVLHPLPNAEKGKVMLRLAPFPSGPLHIGNARMVLLNDEYAKMYDGKLLLVFDDTIGSEEKIPILEGYDLIKEGLDYLGVKVHGTYYKSDRIPLFYEWGRKLIENGHAYACECDSPTIRKNRNEMFECEHRQRAKESNLELWDRMLAGSFKEGEICVRIKSDMKHPDPAFRDRVMFRIAEKEHPRVGSKYRVWPMLEISWAVDDQLLGITHIIRGKDLVIEDMMEKLIWQYMGLKEKTFVHYGMLRVAEAKLSKSKSAMEVRSGGFTGWDDPRTWSIQSLRRRGIRAEAIRKFVLSFGISLVDIEAPADSLYNENRKLIDPTTQRRFFVPNGRSFKLVGEHKPEVELKNHPDEPLGTRKVRVKEIIWLPKEDSKEGSEIRLKDFCNVAIEGDKARITSLDVKPIPKVQWVGDGAQRCDVLLPDGSTLNGFIEPNHLPVGSMVQLERFGFVRIERWDDSGVAATFAHK